MSQPPRAIREYTPGSGARQGSDLICKLDARQEVKLGALLSEIRTKWLFADKI